MIAAAYAYSPAAGAHAVLVKLTRTTMIVPVTVALALTRGTRTRWSAAVPWFLVWFVAVAALRTAGVLPSGADGGLREASSLLIAVALAAIGLSTRLGDLRRAGVRPLLLGTAVWAAVAVTSLLLQGV